jgi:hypothetical protein
MKLCTKIAFVVLLGGISLSYGQDTSGYSASIRNLQESFDCNYDTAVAYFNIIENFVEKVQTDFEDLASSDEDFSVKLKRVKPIITKYFENEYSNVQVSNLRNGRIQLFDYPVRQYLVRLASKGKMFSRVELLFWPDYLGMGRLYKVGENYEISVSMWQIFRGWIENRITYEDATKKKFRLVLIPLGNGRLQLTIGEIMVTETIDLLKFKSKIQIDK